MPVPYRYKDHSAFWEKLGERPPVAQQRIIQLFIDDYADLSRPDLKSYKKKLENFPGQVATLLMGRGFVEQAQRLVEEGVEPALVDGDFPGLGQFGGYQPLAKSGSKNTALSILVSTFDGHNQSTSRLLAARRKALEVMSQNPARWRFDPNERHPQLGPALSRALGLPGKHTERMDFARMLHSLGANASMSAPQDNPLVKLFYHAGDLHYLKQLRPLFEEVVSWNPQLRRQAAPGLLATLAGWDAWRYVQGFDKGEQCGPWGPWSQAILSMGIVDFHSEDLTALPREEHPFACMLEHALTRHASAWAKAFPQALDWKSPSGETFLSIAAEGGTIAQQKLLALVPDALLRPYANVPDSDGNYPIHKAVAACSVGMVEKLLSLGANPRLTNAKGQLPVQAVKRTGEKAKRHLQEIGKLLAGGKPLSAAERDAFLLQAVRSNSPQLARQMLEEGANARLEAGGRTLLELALQANRTIMPSGPMWERHAAAQAELVSLLLEHGAPLALHCSQGQPLTLLALQTKNAPLIQVLIDHGLDITAEVKGKYAWEHLNLEGAFDDEDAEEIAEHIREACLRSAPITWAVPVAKVIAKAAGAKVLETRASRPPFFPFQLVPEIRQLLDLATLDAKTPQPIAPRGRRI